MRVGKECRRVLLTARQASVGGIVTFVFALYLSKCAMIFFLSRITKTPRTIEALSSL